MPDLEKLRRALLQEALRCLVRREHSRQELTQKLARKLQTFPAAQELDTEAQAALVASSVDELGDKRFQSDQRFAQQRVIHRGARYGNLRIKQELLQRGVDDQTIINALEEGESELVRCHSVWLKKFGKAATGREEIAKQVRFLQYRGFSGATIRHVMKISSDLSSDELTLEES